MNELDPERQAEVRKRLAAGESERVIAREVGVSSVTVQRYADMAGPLACGCGRPRSHKGFCAARRQKSSVVVDWEGKSHTPTITAELPGFDPKTAEPSEEMRQIAARLDVLARAELDRIVVLKRGVEDGLRQIEEARRRYSCLTLSRRPLVRRRAPPGRAAAGDR